MKLENIEKAAAIKKELDHYKSLIKSMEDSYMKSFYIQFVPSVGPVHSFQVMNDHSESINMIYLFENAIKSMEKEFKNLDEL